MHNLLDVKFQSFVEEYDLQKESEEENWKRFVNYHFFSQFQPGRFETDFDLLEQTCISSMLYTELHGALFLLNNQIVFDTEDIGDILKGSQKGIFDFYFLTTGDVNKLLDQLENLFERVEETETDAQWLRVLKYAVSTECVLKWRDNPVLHVVSYVENVEQTIEYTGVLRNYFSEIELLPVTAKQLQNIINSNENSFCFSLEAPSSLIISGGDEQFGNAFVICISGDELVKMITTSEGILRKNLFDDNVRDSQGDSAVNQEILATLQSNPGRFALYNNGITIVCKSAVQDNRKYSLENPQIVNGCQTCTMLYQAYRDKVDLSDVQVIAKIVGSNKEDVTQGIVRGANRQNIVYEEAFETVREFHKNLERYFENKEVPGYEKIYYERRSRQYADDAQVKLRNKIGFRGLIQSMVALFLNHVEDSHRHEYTLLKKYRDYLFLDTHSLDSYYMAAFLYLQVDSYFRRGILPKELRGYKFHIMLLVKEMKAGNSPELFSREIDAYCERFLMELSDGRLETYAKEACDKFKEIQEEWIAIKGEQYRFGIKDNVEFRNFLMKKIHGETEIAEADKIYTGRVMNVSLDKHNTLFGFIERPANNIFFHEFDNPNISKSYVGKKVSYQVAVDKNRERAVNVRLVR